MAETSAETVAAELDAAHLRAQQAFESRDLEAYMAVFSPGLAYRQANGKTICRDQLARDVSVQFRRLRAAVSSYRRESLQLIGDEVQELLEQKASASATAFFVVHRTWELRRRAVYRWRKANHRWQIIDATILEEHLPPGGFTFGLRPPPLMGKGEGAA